MSGQHDQKYHLKELTEDDINKLSEKFKVFKEQHNNNRTMERKPIKTLRKEVFVYTKENEIFFLKKIKEDLNINVKDEEALQNFLREMLSWNHLSSYKEKSETIYIKS